MGIDDWTRLISIGGERPIVFSDFAGFEEVASSSTRYWSATPQPQELELLNCSGLWRSISIANTRSDHSKLPDGRRLVTLASEDDLFTHQELRVVQ